MQGRKSKLKWKSPRKLIWVDTAPRFLLSPPIPHPTSSFIAKNSWPLVLLQRCLHDTVKRCFTFCYFERLKVLHGAWRSLLKYLRSCVMHYTLARGIANDLKTQLPWLHLGKEAWDPITLSLLLQQWSDKEAARLVHGNSAGATDSAWLWCFALIKKKRKKSEVSYLSGPQNTFSLLIRPLGQS